MAVCVYGGIARADFGALSCLLPVGGASARPGVTGAQHRHRGGETFGGKFRRKRYPVTMGLGLLFPAHEATG